MKIAHILSTSVLAGAVLLSASACAPVTDKLDGASAIQATESATPVETATPEPEVTESPVEEIPTTEAAPTETPFAEPAVSPEPTKAVAAPTTAVAKPAVAPKPAPATAASETPSILKAVNGFYDYTEKRDNFDNVMEVNNIIQKNPQLSDADAKAVVAALPGVFQYFDTSTAPNVRNAYSEISATLMGVRSGPGSTTFNVPASAVQYDAANGTATVDKNKVVVTIDGEAQPTYPGEPNNLNLIKKGGKWVIVAVPNGL